VTTIADMGWIVLFVLFVIPWIGVGVVVYLVGTSTRIEFPQWIRSMPQWIPVLQWGLALVLLAAIMTVVLLNR
jgi:hypothetical protein